MLWLVLPVIALISLHIFTRSLNRRERKLLAHLPTFSSIPFIGNVHWFIGDGKRAVHHLETISHITEEKGQPFVIWVGQHCIIVLSDLKESKIVANAFIEKPHYYNFAHMWLRDGLLTAPGFIWKRNVKKIASSFNGAMLHGFQQIFNDKAAKLVQLLKKESNSEPFDLMHKHLAYIALQAIFETALSKSDSVKNTATKDYHKALQRLLELIFHRFLNVCLHPEVIFRLTPAYREMKRWTNVIDNISETILKRRRIEKEEEKTANTKKCTDTEIEGEPFKSFLDTLLEMSDTDKSLTDSQIQAEVNTIIFAGQETVTTALNFVFLILGCKPDVQRKVYEEVKEVFGDSKRSVEKEDLLRLRYCEAVICETMRLFPPVPGVLRLADRDLKLESCTIPKGATCVLFFWGLSRSRRLWKDALNYQPERWLEPDVDPALLNFSLGRRACFGKRYAMMLMKTIMAYCVREFEFTSDADNMKLRLDVTMQPFAGHLLSVRLRNSDIHTTVSDKTTRNIMK